MKFVNDGGCADVVVHTELNLQVATALQQCMRFCRSTKKCFELEIIFTWNRTYENHVGAWLNVLSTLPSCLDKRSVGRQGRMFFFEGMIRALFEQRQ